MLTLALARTGWKRIKLLKSVKLLTKLVLVAYLYFMKSVALILLTCYSFFMVQPPMLQVKESCHKEMSCKMSCCHKDKTAPSSNKNTKKNCNMPFYCPFCGTGSGFVVTKVVTSPAALNTVIEISSIYNQPLTAQVMCECWQPPENTLVL